MRVYTVFPFRQEESDIGGPEHAAAGGAGGVWRICVLGGQ